MRGAALFLASLLALLAAERAAVACAVCAAEDPTIDAPGLERAFAHRLRLGAEALAGSVSEAAADGRLLTVSDLRFAVNAQLAASKDLLLSATLPVLDRALFDGGASARSWVLGDAEARVTNVAWRGGGLVAQSLTLSLGVKLPTAPEERDLRGAPLPDELQPGCGSVVPYAGAAYSARRGALSGQASALVYLPFSVRDGPHAGDSLRLTAFTQVQATMAVATRFGVKVRIDGTGELAPGIADLNSGGLAGYVTSDLLLRPTPDLVISFGGAFPVVQAFLGTHRETAIANVQVGIESLTGLSNGRQKKGSVRAGGGEPQDAAVWGYCSGHATRSVSLSPRYPVPAGHRGMQN